jgi:PAS domain S-box-containing protein
MVGLRGGLLLDERAATVARAEAALRELARVVEEYVIRVFETSDLVAEGVATRVAELGGTGRLRGDVAAHHWLRDLSERVAGDYLLIVDATGRPVTVSSAHPPPEVDLSDRRWFQAHLAGEERHIGEAIHSRLTDEVLFTYSRILRRPDGTFDGAVQVAVRPGFFQQPGLLAEIGGATTLGLFDEEGRVLARTGLRPDTMGLRLAPDLLGLQPGEATVRRREAITPADPEERMVALRRLPEWPLVVLASVPVEQVLAEWRRALGWSAAVLGALSVAVILATLQALRMMRREARVRVALAEANAALRQAAQGLEARVAERTAELSATHAALAGRERRFRAIFDSTFQLVVLLDTAGVVIEVNETSLGFMGFTRQEAVGRPFAAEHWWPEEAERARVAAAIAAAARGEPQRYQTTASGAGGAVVAVDFSLRPVRDAAGRVELLVAEGHDVTELKAAEARLHESQKTEMLGQLTGGVAHDFNNLLMAVLGNLALLRKRLPEEPRLTRLLDGAQQGAERGAALTQRLLAFARRQELRPEPVDLAELVRGVAPLLERSAGPAVRISLDLPDGLAPALADANQLELALLNLVVNARDAMPGGGEIGLSVAARVAPAPDAPAGIQPGAYLALTVRDAGQGMDPATLARATEPFFTTKGPGRGSGLGLSMVQGLAAQSGGGLALRSRPGEGTQAVIWLPRSAEPVREARAAPPAPPPAVAAPSASRAGSLVLVVDDDPLVAAGTAMMLEDLGYRTAGAASAEEALDRLAEEPGIDLVVTDHAMPGMTGLELAERLRRERPGLPVVLATGYADLAGGPPWLPRLDKPYRQEELAATVARMLPGSRAA